MNKHTQKSMFKHSSLLPHMLHAFWVWRSSHNLLSMQVKTKRIVLISNNTFDLSMTLIIEGVLSWLGVMLSGSFFWGQLTFFSDNVGGKRRYLIYPGAKWMNFSWDAFVCWLVENAHGVIQKRYYYLNIKEEILQTKPK